MTDRTDMPTAYHGDVELFFETFGSATNPTLLLINGLGSQCINYDEKWCEKFAARGYRVIRFDNRDTGLSSKLDERAYALRDMAGDAMAVLDTAKAEVAHVMGVSMGTVARNGWNVFMLPPRTYGLTLKYEM